MYCIQETDKLNRFNRFFNIITMYNNKIILPITCNDFTNKKKAEKMAVKTKKILNRTNSKKVAISKLVNECKPYVNYLYEEGLDIVDGRFLFKVLSFDVVEYVLKKQDLTGREIRSFYSGK